MQNRKAHSVITWALLLHFVLFVIPPLSALVSFDDDLSSFGETYALSKNQTGSGMYIIDMLLWAQLEESDHQDAYVISHVGWSSQNDHNGIIAVTNDILATPFLLCPSGRQLDELYFPKASAVYFECSGISPPALS